MKTLVTGGTGFLGVPAVRLLIERGAEVHVVSRHDPEAEQVPGARYHRIDLLNDRASAEQLVHRLRPERLLHLAWTTTPGTYWTSPDNLDWVGASLSLFRAFVEAGGQRVVVAGTCAEYDWSSEILSETRTPLRPRTLYGSAKHALHLLIEAAALETTLSVAWARLFFLYGPGEARGRLVPSVLAWLSSGELALVSEGSQVRDFLHVEDAGRALDDVLDAPTVGAINIASGYGVPIRELVQTLGELLGRADLVRFGARPSPTHEPQRLVGDTQRLRQEVQFRPRFDLRAGLLDTVQRSEAAARNLASRADTGE